jgi:enamine deaminase RidA (YjgF/YER057c/UK114 family)
MGAGLTVEQGDDGARQACLNCLADVKAVIGDLDQVKRVAKRLCMVNSAPDFGQQPVVANGATDLLRALYGDAGAHARSAVGVAALPNGACIEMEMILEVADSRQHAQFTSKRGRSSPLGPLPAEA